ncbi:MAG: hypothetical protein IJH64_11160 [Oscillospiraceae bacterium]|nr:hypothetical protein [Oscillospiraceae bacterium]MBR0450710.1 hypothetical protein [Oscillospiraceae bacterium]
MRRLWNLQIRLQERKKNTPSNLLSNIPPTRKLNCILIKYQVSPH